MNKFIITFTMICYANIIHTSDINKNNYLSSAYHDNSDPEQIMKRTDILNHNLSLQKLESLNSECLPKKPLKYLLQAHKQSLICQLTINNNEYIEDSALLYYYRKKLKPTYINQTFPPCREITQQDKNQYKRSKKRTRTILKENLKISQLIRNIQKIQDAEEKQDQKRKKS